MGQGYTQRLGNVRGNKLVSLGINEVVAEERLPSLFRFFLLSGGLKGN